MKIYLATSNNHKQREMIDLFPGFEIVIPSQEGITFDPIESGTSFIENSLIKAKTLWDIVKQPVLADDSGLCVDALKGFPGIYSARYGGKDFRKGKPHGEKTPQEEQNRLLIEEVNEILGNESIHSKNRNCRYVCAMVLYLGTDRFYSVQETMEGSIITSLDTARGQGGFGYDPIVILQNTNKTIAELSPEEKNNLSHRGKAAKMLYTLLTHFE